MAEAKSLDQDIQAYDAAKLELEKQYLGQFVVYYDGEFIGAYDSFNTAAADAVRQFGRGPYLIRQVGAKPATLPASVLFQPANA